MRFTLISDNMDTLSGMRLAGIEGELVHTTQAVQDSLTKAMQDPEIGIVLITTNLCSLCSDFIVDCRNRYPHTLIVEIPDRHQTSSFGDSLIRYVNDAIGVRITDDIP